MDFIQYDLPPVLQWLGFVMAAIALGLSVMMSQTIFQMIWGRPLMELDLSEEEYDEDGTRNLVCYVSNPPVRSRLLSAIGVRRATLEGVSGTFSINEAGSGKLIHASQTAFLVLSIGHNATVLSLPSSETLEAAILLVGTDRHGKTHIIQPREGVMPVKPIYLNPGMYDVELDVEGSGQMKQITGRFIVEHMATGLHWL